MSKILQKGDIGFGVLLEQDSGYIELEMNKSLISEGFKFNENEPILINCILQKYGVKNRNGRIYPEDILRKQVSEYQRLVDENSAPGEADHPDTSNISLHNESHLIKKMWWGNGENKHILYGQLELIVSPGYIKYGVVSMVGDKILEYLKRGQKIGISSRGVGSIKEVNGVHIVQSDFELIGFDLVSTPSTFGAFLFPENNQIEMQEKLIINGNKINENCNSKIKIISDFLDF